jgi:hypothetical protein
MTAPQRVSVLRPLVSEQLDDQGLPESVSISFTELASLRQRPPVREEFHNTPDAPKYRVLGRTSEGFLVVGVIRKTSRQVYAIASSEHA